MTTQNKNERRSSEDYLQEVWDSLEPAWDKSKFDMKQGYDSEYECDCITINSKDNEGVLAKIYVNDYEGRHPVGFDVVYRYPGDKGVGVIGSYEFQSTNMDGLGEEVFDYFDEIKKKVGESMNKNNFYSEDEVLRVLTGLIKSDEFRKVMGTSVLVNDIEDNLEELQNAFLGSFYFDDGSFKYDVTVENSADGEVDHGPMFDACADVTDKVLEILGLPDSCWNTVQEYLFYNGVSENIVSESKKSEADATFKVGDFVKYDAESDGKDVYDSFIPCEVVDVNDDGTLGLCVYGSYANEEGLGEKASASCCSKLDHYAGMVDANTYYTDGKYKAYKGGWEILITEKELDPKVYEFIGTMDDLSEVVDFDDYYGGENFVYDEDLRDDLGATGVDTDGVDFADMSGDVAKASGSPEESKKSNVQEKGNKDIYTLDLTRIDGDGNEEGLDDMQAAQSFYDEDGAIKAAKELADSYKDYNDVVQVTVMAGEQEKPNGDIVGEPSDIFTASSSDSETTAKYREKAGYTKTDGLDYYAKGGKSEGNDDYKGCKGKDCKGEAKKSEDASVHELEFVDIDEVNSASDFEKIVYDAITRGSWDIDIDATVQGAALNNDLIFKVRGIYPEAISEVSKMLAGTGIGFLVDGVVQNEDTYAKKSEGAWDGWDGKDPKIGTYYTEDELAILKDVFKKYVQEVSGIHYSVPADYTISYDIAEDPLNHFNAVVKAVGKNGKPIYLCNLAGEVVWEPNTPKQFLHYIGQVDPKTGEEKKGKYVIPPRSFFLDDDYYANAKADTRIPLNPSDWNTIDNYFKKFFKQSSESKKSESLTLKQKELKDMARFGQAEDITTISDVEAKELKKKGIETVGISRGTYGMNGALLRDNEGKKYVITARSSNLFYFV